MPQNKPRLQLAFYARPKHPASYHYALFVAAKDVAVSPITKYHVKNTLQVNEAGETTSAWRYERDDIARAEDELRLLIRVSIAKITIPIEQLDEVLKSIPVHQTDDPDKVKAETFDCRAWVREAFLELQARKAIGVRFQDWDFVERQALEYVDEKRRQGRWEQSWKGKAGVPLFDLLERREVVERQNSHSTSSEESELNGIQIQRLKSKLGTHALPTAELVLTDMRVWRLGKPGQGVKEISTVLNITRLHNSVTAVGYLGRGLAISRAFSKVRTARGILLMDTPAHVSTLASLHVEYRAMMHLSFYTAALLGLSEHPSTPSSSEKSPAELSPLLPKDSLHLLRLLTPLSKSLTARAAIAGLAESMESLDGVGYLENEDITMNIARIFRDANVLSIWEGTTNIQADDLIRILKGRNGDATLQALGGVVEACCDHWRGQKGFEDSGRVVRGVWEKVERDVKEKSKEELSLDGRAILEDFGFLICALLLGEDALSDGDEISKEIILRWIAKRGNGCEKERPWKERAIWDRRIVFGNGDGKREVARL